LALIVADPGKERRHPPSHAFGNAQRILVARLQVHVDHARHNLVIGVKRSPHLLSTGEALKEIRGIGA